MNGKRVLFETVPEQRRAKESKGEQRQAQERNGEQRRG